MFDHFAKFGLRNSVIINWMEINKTVAGSDVRIHLITRKLMEISSTRTLRMHGIRLRNSSFIENLKNDEKPLNICFETD